MRIGLFNIFDGGGSNLLGTPTENGLAIGQGDSTPISWTDAPTDGQLLIGFTGNSPVLSNITAGTGITIVNGAGSIVISSDASGMSWVDATTSSVSLAVNKGYITNRSAGVSYQLPTTASLGDLIEIVGKNGSWNISQGAGQVIYLGASNTTSGISGSIASTNPGDCVTLRCISSGASTAWRVVSSMGNLSFV